MNINIKNVTKYFVMLLIGFSLLFYGIIGMVIKDKSMTQITDNEIIEKAKELGMVSINEVFLRELEESE